MNRSFSHIQAIIFAIGAFALWVLTDSCMKLGADAAIPPQEIICVFAFVGMIALAIKAWCGGGIRTLGANNLRAQVISAVLSLGINLLNVVALKHLPFTLFYIAAFTAPMVIALLGARFLREHMTLGKTIAIIVGFGGVIIAINPFNSDSGNMHGDGFGYAVEAGAVLCFAGNMVLQRSIMKSENADSLAFTQALFMVLSCGFLMFFAYVPLSPFLLLLLCGGGILNTAGNLCSMTASKHTTAATVAQFHYTQIISGALIGYLVWHEVPTPHLVAGSAIIIVSGLYIASHVRKARIVPAIKPP